MTNLTTLLLTDGAVAGWTITAIVTFFLIVLPTLYLLVLSIAADDEAIERTVRRIGQYTKAKARAREPAS